jgi:hypothetical protein
MRASASVGLALLCLVTASCFDDVHLGSHPCDACQPCEVCIEITAGVARCEALPSETRRCGSDGHVYAVDACGELGAIADRCDRGFCARASATEVACTCSNRWQGEHCATCPGNWDPAQDCNVCRNRWTGAECDECPDGFDPDQDCAACAGHFEGAECDVCPGNWDPEEGCATCKPPYADEDNDCGSCASNCPALDALVCEGGRKRSCVGTPDCLGWGNWTQCNTSDCAECAGLPDHVQDCAGVWGGLASEDACGTCDEDPQNDCPDCAVDNGGCDPLTTCTNWVGSRICGPCPAGHSGDGATGCVELNCAAGYVESGRACVDVDECATGNGGCDALTACTNTPGARTCGACPAGYTGDGETGCTDIDECLTGNGGCDALTACTNTPGSRTCSNCPYGYVGAGDGECLPAVVGFDTSTGTLSPTFSPEQTLYTLRVPRQTATLQVTPTTTAGVTARVDGVPVASGSPSAPIALALGPNDIVVTAEAAGRTPRDYAVTVVVAWLQEAYVKASNTGVDDSFGVSSMALSGDTLAVGAHQEDSSATGIGGSQTNNSAVDSGAVYVFTRTAGVWSQQAYVKASNTQSGDFFGRSVALSGDTLAVGAYGEDSSAAGIGGDQSDNGAAASGAVYVFRRVGNSWSQQAYLKASNSGTGDGFGWSVALTDDTLAVGAFGEDSSATGIGGAQGSNASVDSGAAYVFTRSGTVWSQQAYVKASNTGANDFFGVSVALSGDTLAVGANEEDSSATGVEGNQSDNSFANSGAAYVFTRSGGVWSQQAYVKASNTGANDSFGRSLALSGDTLAVAARDEDSNATGVGGNQASPAAPDSGAVYVFTRSGSVWSQQAYVKASNTGSGDAFGGSLALLGDMLAVGAGAEDSSATGVDGDQGNDNALNAGAVYVFTRTGGVWSQEAYLKASNTEAYDVFGSSVAVSADTIAVSAYGEDSAATGVGGTQSNNGASLSGAVYISR